MSCELALNTDQWKSFSEKYKLIRVWWCLGYKFTKNDYCLWLFSEFTQTQKRYLTSINFFFWTKHIETLFLAKHLMSFWCNVNNLCEKLVSSKASPITFYDILWVSFSAFFVADFDFLYFSADIESLLY